MTLSKFLYILTVVYFFFSKQFVINVTVIFKTLCKSLFTIHVTYNLLNISCLITLYISLGVFKVGFSKKKNWILSSTTSVLQALQNLLFLGVKLYLPLSIASLCKYGLFFFWVLNQYNFIYFLNLSL